MSEKIELIFNPNDTAINFTKVMNESLQTVNYGIRLIESSDEVSGRFKNSSEDFLHLEVGVEATKVELDSHLKNVLLCKATEDCIKGIILTMCNAYTLLVLSDKYKGMMDIPVTDICNSQEGIYKKAQSFSLPRLINEIEKKINKDLLLKDEIITINKVRNCLSHRNGIVFAPKDINNSDLETLDLKMLYIGLYQIEDNVEVEVGGVVSVSSDNPATMKIENFTKSFKANEGIDLTYKEVQCIFYTCSQFVNNIVKEQIEFLTSLG
ncbi:MAG: hypothetical protein OCD02_11115 [Spirochaetaceae bacterium]